MEKIWKNGPEDRIAFVDVESTGLDPSVDQLLEVAIVVTDFDLVEVASFTRVVRPEGRIREMEPVVFSMRATSGLLEAIAREGSPADEVDQQAEAFMAENGAAGGPIAGSTPSFDQRFLAFNLPLLRGCFNHRCFDVSTLKQAYRMWCGERPKDEPRHRALADVRGSIEECRFLRSVMFPGSTAALAKQVQSQFGRPAFAREIDAKNVDELERAEANARAAAKKSIESNSLKVLDLTVEEPPEENFEIPF